MNASDPVAVRVLARLCGLLLIGGVLLAAPTFGCAGVPARAPAGVWENGPPNGRVVHTANYAIHTTIFDNAFLRELARQVEAAHYYYRQLAAPGQAVDGPLEAYVFARRDEWEEFTRRHTGPLSAVYLQIHRGGYAHGSVFATFFHGEQPTLAVCRHEGFHQYVATGFIHRPPPFLEEGVATLFETAWDEESNRPTTNFARLTRLHEAVRRKRTWPLETLLTMHAGDVIAASGREVDTFYAQAWALALFCLEERRLGDLLSGYATGRFAPGTRQAQQAMEQAMGKPFPLIERDYQRFVLKVTGLETGDNVAAAFAAEPPPRAAGPAVLADDHAGCGD